MDPVLVYSLIALLIGAIVRALKSDKIPINIPPEYRAPLALFLGAFGGVVDSWAGDTVLWKGLLMGVAAGCVAVAGHDVVVEGVRGGKEPFSGKLKPPTLPLLAIALSLAGCTALQRQHAVDVAGLVCQVVPELSSDAGAVTICAVEQELQPVIRRLVAAKATADAEVTRAALTRAIDSLLSGGAQ